MYYGLGPVRFGEVTDSVSMKYKVVLRQTDEGYSVSCPGLPGCWSQGKTEAEAIGNIRDAIAEYQAAVAGTLVGENVREVEVAD
jgi:predicted RNase H-like HicB family nuclease